MTEVRRLTKEEIDYLSNLPNVNKSAIAGIFREPRYELETYDYNVGLLHLDHSLFKWSKETLDAGIKGFNAVYKGTRIIK